MRSPSLVPVSIALILLTGCAARTDAPPPVTLVASTELQYDDGAVHSHFRVSYSEKLDAAVFLDTISSDPTISAPWQELGVSWWQQMQEDPAVVAAFSSWQGRGIPLAYLLSSIRENDLTRTVERFQAPTALMEALQARFDEPAHQGALADFGAGVDELHLLLGYLEQHGFGEMRLQGHGDALADTRARLEPVLDALETTPLQDWLETFTGRQVESNFLDIYVLAFSRPASFQLSGWAVAWAGEPDDPAWPLTRAFMYKYNPSPELLEQVSPLVEADTGSPPSGADEGPSFAELDEAPMVEAATLYVAHQLHLLPEVRILRSLAPGASGPHPLPQGRPLAAVIYDALLAAQVGIGPFDYDAFLVDLLQDGALTAEELATRYQRILQPVAGRSGLALRADGPRVVVASVVEGSAGAQAGVAAGDPLLAVGDVTLGHASLEDARDLLAGPVGAARAIQIDRGAEPIQIHLTLR